MHSSRAASAAQCGATGALPCRRITTGSARSPAAAPQCALGGPLRLRRRERGYEIVPPRYRLVGDYRFGFAQVDIDGKSGLIDRDGKLAIEPRYGFIQAIALRPLPRLPLQSGSLGQALDAGEFPEGRGGQYSVAIAQLGHWRSDREGHPRDHRPQQSMDRTTWFRRSSIPEERVDPHRSPESFLARVPWRSSIGASSAAMEAGSSSLNSTGAGMRSATGSPASAGGSSKTGYRSQRSSRYPPLVFDEAWAFAPGSAHHRRRGRARSVGAHRPHRRLDIPDGSP